MLYSQRLILNIDATANAHKCIPNRPVKNQADGDLLLCYITKRLITEERRSHIKITGKIKQKANVRQEATTLASKLPWKLWLLFGHKQPLRATKMKARKRADERKMHLGGCKLAAVPKRTWCEHNCARNGSKTCRRN